MGEGAGRVVFSNSARLSLIAGPYQIESREHAFMVAGTLKNCDKLGIGLVYKSSFDKANRTSLSAQRTRHRKQKRGSKSSPISRRFGFQSSPTSTAKSNCADVATVVDVLQIGLGRQTDLLVAAARPAARHQHQEGSVPGAVGHEERACQAECRQPEHHAVRAQRLGFGYNTLVSGSMRSLPIMEAMGAPVVFDAAHSVQQPGGQGGSSGGARIRRDAGARRSPSVWPACSSRRMKTPTTPHRMARTWSISRTCRA